MNNYIFTLFLFFASSYSHSQQSCNQLYSTALTNCQLQNLGDQAVPVGVSCDAGMGGIGNGNCTTISQSMENYCITQAEIKMRKSMETGLCFYDSSGNTPKVESADADAFDVIENTGQADPNVPSNAPIPPRRPSTQTETKQGAGKEGQGNSESKESVQPSQGITMADLQSDLQSCSNFGSEAQKCCTNPRQCGASGGGSSILPPSSNDPEGIKRYCEQLKYASLRGQSANSDAAGVCSSSNKACSLKCSKSKEKWQQALSNCRAPNCDPAKVQQALNIFSKNDSECKGLVENERLLARQSGENVNSAREAQLCAQQSAIDPASAGQMADQASQALNNQNQGPDCSGDKASSPECLDCSKYPNSPLCGGGYQNQNNGFETGSVGGGAVSEAEGGSAEFGSFNVGAGTDGLPQFPQFGGYQPQAVSNPGVQNGGGGGIPNMGGAAGGGGFGGEQGSSAGGRGGYNTDVLGGERGGGGGGSVSANPAAVSGGGGFSGYGAGAGDEEFKNKYGMDLKAYLPGGAKDPKRVIANAPVGTGHPEIAPIGESMFKRISNKFSQMCKAKQFIGCE